MRPSLRALLPLIATLAASAPAGAAEEAAKAAAPAPAALESFDDQAKFLAGLPVAEGSPLFAVEQGKDWKDYAKGLEADWAKLKERRLDQMVEFASKELHPRIDPKANLFYFFGGPDFISPAVLYPDAPVYVLAGLEPIGQVPQISTLKRSARDAAIANMRKSIGTTVRSSFFKTNDMAVDLTKTELRGVLPILFMFVARADAKLVDVKYVELDDQGGVHELEKGARAHKTYTQGVRLKILRAGKDKEQEIYYLRQNVENTVLATVPGFLAFFKKLAPANHFFKAASFILHNTKRFSATRDFVLENALSILQDDSGVPFAQLKKSRWQLYLYGRYLRPLPPFTRHLQEDLVKAFAAGPVAPLPFVTGYRRPGDANLVLAIARPPGTELPEEETKPEPALKPARNAKGEGVKAEPAKAKVEEKPDAAPTPKAEPKPEPKAEPKPAEPAKL